MVKDVVNYVVNGAKSMKHEKENQDVMIEFRDTIISDIDTVLCEAHVTKISVEKVLEDRESIVSTEFIINKLMDEYEKLSKHIESLTKSKTKEIKQFRLLDIYKAYNRIMRIERCTRNIKEYTSRIREDKLLYNQEN